MNVTLETLEKISVNLNIPIEDLVKNVGSVKNKRKYDDQKASEKDS